MTNQLSPAAQAVLDEMYEVNMDFGEENARLAAAALRAAADQVVPVCSTKSDRGVQRMMIRNDILCIANELEGADA